MADRADAEPSHQTKGLVRLTMACNERCPFCNVPVEDYPRPTPPDDAVQAELDAFVATGERTLTISGGEPTLLRRRLLATIRAARERGVPLVELQTNAVLVDAGYARALADAGLTSAFVSLLSEEPALHDALAGLDGAYPRCLAGIDALVAAGVRVTLNPVLARATQGRFAAYVAFVAERLPAVRSISVSAVQPHGRAAAHADVLLPDYDVLAAEVPRARAVARAHGIELLNPYCGLPVCVGWADDPDRCVEAVEAAAGGWRATVGVENTGDKRHGPPCVDCAWRTRCGGAWTAVWELRGGRGIAPPARVRPPWEKPAGSPPPRTAAEPATPGEAVVAGRPAPDAATWHALRQSAAATVWLHVGALGEGDGARVLPSGCAHLALDLDPTGAARRLSPTLATTLREAAAVLRAPGRPVPVWLRVRRGAGATDADQAVLVAWARRAGVDRLTVVRGGGERLRPR